MWPGSGMFSGSQNFTVAGGTFTNVTTYTTARTGPSGNILNITCQDADIGQTSE
jgi:hypothetical protein